MIPVRRAFPRRPWIYHWTDSVRTALQGSWRYSLGQQYELSPDFWTLTTLMPALGYPEVCSETKPLHPKKL